MLHIRDCLPPAVLLAGAHFYFNWRNISWLYCVWEEDILKSLDYISIFGVNSGPMSWECSLHKCFCPFLRCYGLNCMPPKDTLISQLLAPVNKTLYLEIGSLKVTKDKLRSYWIRVALNPSIDVLERKGRFEGTEETQGRRPHDDGNREFSDVATGQGT